MTLSVLLARVVSRVGAVLLNAPQRSVMGVRINDFITKRIVVVEVEQVHIELQAVIERCVRNR